MVKLIVRMSIFCLGFRVAVECLGVGPAAQRVRNVGCSGGNAASPFVTVWCDSHFRKRQR